MNWYLRNEEQIILEKETGPHQCGVIAKDKIQSDPSALLGVKSLK